MLYETSILAAGNIEKVLRFVSLSKDLIYGTILKTQVLKNRETVREKKGMIARIFLVHFDSS